MGSTASSENEAQGGNALQFSCFIFANSNEPWKMLKTNGFDLNVLNTSSS
jgi:hypothetical protein